MGQHCSAASSKRVMATARAVAAALARAAVPAIGKPKNLIKKKQQSTGSNGDDDDNDSGNQ